MTEVILLHFWVRPLCVVVSSLLWNQMSQVPISELELDLALNTSLALDIVLVLGELEIIEKLLRPHCLLVCKVQFFLPSCSGWVLPPPHISSPLKLHSFLSKRTICRSPSPLGPSHLTSTWPQSLRHPYALTHHPWPQLSHYPYSPTNAPPLGPNHPTTHHTFAPTHPPHLTQPTHHPWPQSPCHP